MVVAVVLGAGAAWFVWTKRGDAPLVWQALKTASPLWLGIALALTAVLMINQAMFYGASQRALGVHLPNRELWRTTNAAFFINTIAKSGGLAGVTAFTSAAARHGQSRARTVAAYVVVAVLSQLGFAASLVAAIVVLVRSGGLTTADLIGSTIFGIYTVILTTAVFAAFRSRRLLRRLHALPGRIKRAGLRLIGRPPAETEVDTTEADELYDAMQLLRANPRALGPTILHALGVEVLGVALLWATLHAVGASVGLTVPLVAYSVSVMFFIIGILPGGLGFVEASLGVILTGFGVAVGPVAATVVLYRLLQLWVPFAVGAVAVRRATKTT